MTHRERASRPRLLPVACLLTVACGVGCAPAADPESDFGRYTGPAVAVPYEADASVAIGNGGGTGGTGTGGTGTSGGSTTGAGTGGAGASTGNAGGEATGATGADADAGASTGATGSSGSTGSVATDATLSFSVLTKAVGGRYAPRNVGAIWVETAAGKWVKTLAVWAATRERYLTRYVAASARNRVDAVTSATLSSHKTHAVTWDSTDVNGKVVPDGDYRVVVEITDQNSTGDSTVVPFTKGPSAVNLKPADTAHFVTMSMSYQ